MFYEILNHSGKHIGGLDAPNDEEAMRLANLFAASHERPLILECRERNESWRKEAQDAVRQYRMSQQ